MRGSPSRLQVYIVKRTVGWLGAALLNITFMVMLISFEELSRRFSGRSDVGLGRMAEVVLLESPVIILLLLPFVFLFGNLAAFVNLNRRSELIAMRAAGISAWQFILPTAGMAFVIGVVTVVALNPIATRLNGRAEDLKTAIGKGPADYNGPSEIWLRQGDDRTQIVIHAASHYMVGGVVGLGQVSIFVQKVTPGGALTFSRRIEASQARLESGFWQLSDVRESSPGAGSVRSASLSIPSNLDRRSAMETFIEKDLVDFWRLPETIAKADAAGFSSAPYRLRWQELLATPFMFASMALLGASFSLRVARLGGLAGLAGIGVAGGFSIFFLDRMCGALAAADAIPAVAGAWAPPLLSLLAGFTMLCYTEDG